MRRTIAAFTILLALGASTASHASDASQSTEIVPGLCEGEEPCRVEYNLILSISKDGTVVAGTDYRSIDECKAGGKGIVYGRTGQDVPAYADFYCAPVPKR